MSKGIIMLGAGGHAKVLQEILCAEGFGIQGIVTPAVPTEFAPFNEIFHYDSDDCVSSFDVHDVILVNGVGSLPDNSTRESLYERFINEGFEFMTLVSPYAIVSPSAIIEPGAQIMAGAIVQSGARVGRNSIINTGAIVDHDCVIGEHNHVAPGVTLSGGVVTGKSVHIGTGASVIQSVSIGNGSVVGAGTTLTKNLPSNSKALGARATVQKVSI